MSENNEIYLNEKEVAELLKRKVGTIQAWRFLKKGPAYFHDPEGAVFYKKSVVMAWFTGGPQEAENRMSKEG